MASVNEYEAEVAKRENLDDIDDRQSSHTDEDLILLPIGYEYHELPSRSKQRPYRVTFNDKPIGLVRISRFSREEGDDIWEGAVKRSNLSINGSFEVALRFVVESDIDYRANCDEE